MNAAILYMKLKASVLLKTKLRNMQIQRHLEISFPPGVIMQNSVSAEQKCTAAVARELKYQSLHRENSKYI